MKRVLLGAMLAAAGAMALSAGACAQETMRVYVSEAALQAQDARRLVEMLDEEFPQTDFELVWKTEGGLRALVLSDALPQLAVCSPREAAPWAGEGLTLPLQRRLDDQTEIAREILSVCVQEENLFMAPLSARRRQMAVNAGMLEKQGLGYMLDPVAHSVWYPTEFQQILEEFAIAGAPAMDVWRMTPPESAAMEALIQAIYGGSVLAEDGQTCTADSAAICAGARWLSEMIAGDMIGYCANRRQAEERFAAGETAVFIDWTREMQEKYAEELRKSGMQIEMRPYPSSISLPVRSYELAGVSAFDSGDAERNALAMDAAAFLYESEEVRRLLGGESIRADDSVFLFDLSASDRGATLRSLLCMAVTEIIEEGRDAREALSLITAGMETAR